MRHKQRFSVPVTVTLECAHAIRIRNPPLHDRVTYSCNAGTGCGYVLRWVSWVQEGSEMVVTNDNFKPKR